MYIETVPNRNSPPAILLREGWREGGKVKKRTLANLSKWPPTLIEGLRVLLKGGAAVSRLRRRLRHRAFQTPRPCRGRARDAAQAATGADDRRGGLARAPTRASDDRRPGPRSGFQAGDRPGLGRGDRARLARRDVGAGRLRRGRSLRRHGLAAQASGRHRAALGQAASEGRRPGALRPDVGVAGRAPLSAGAARLLARRQARQVADRVRAVVRRRGPSGGGGGVRRQHRGPGHRGRADRQAAASVRVLQGGVGGRPRDVDRGAHPRGGAPVRSGLDQRVAGSGGAVPGGIRRGADVAVRPDRPGGDPKRRLSGRAPHGVPQSAAGGGAGAQAGRAAPGHRGVARSHRGGRESGEAAP